MSTITEAQKPGTAWERVWKGARFLEEKRPGWKDSIRNATRPLTMGDPENCLLCHVEKTFSFKMALISIGLTKEEAVLCGFLRHPDDPITMYGDLAQHWHERIRTEF